MKTLLASTMFLHDAMEVRRFTKWLGYAIHNYWPMEGVSNIVFCDHGSKRELLNLFPLHLFMADEPFPAELPPVCIFTHWEDIGQQQGVWRSFRQMAQIAKHYGFDRLVNIESDAYVLSERFRDYLFTQAIGWTAPWCPSSGFPEGNIQVICPDQYDAMMGIVRHEEILGEWDMPFTLVNKGFNGDRWGERGDGSYPSDADFVCQVRTEYPVSNGRFHH